MTPDDLDAKLLFAVDPAYKAFGDKLQPGITDRLGVRMPTVRALVKEILKENPLGYLEVVFERDRPFVSQEALMVATIVAGNLKHVPDDVYWANIDRLLPYMTGWATCDLMGSAVKRFRVNPSRYLPYLASKLASDNPWSVRTAEVWLLEHYRTEEGALMALAALDNPNARALTLAASGDYYLSMALAWCLSMLATVNPEAVYVQMEAWRKAGRLDDETCLRTVRKIRESLQFTRDAKDAVKRRFE